jgi:hypothetical protein
MRPLPDSKKIDHNFSTIKSEISTISDKFEIMDEYVKNIDNKTKEPWKR